MAETALKSTAPVDAGGPAPVAAKLADFALRTRADALPDDVVAHAKLCVLDACGIALASSTFAFAGQALAGVKTLSEAGAFPLIGYPDQLPLRDSVMMNGLLVHGLDFDDTHAGSIVHCTASAWPLTLGAALKSGASGAEALATYVVAVEADARIGNLAEGRFQQRGHHPTGLVGAFGCTLAAGRLLGLDQAALTRAQGIVLSMAAGNLEFLSDGDWTKRLHPGWAGVCALNAVALASGGFRGPKAAYEGRYGLYNLHLGPDAQVDAPQMLKGLTQEWELRDVAFKPYPACHFNHAFADCAIALRENHQLEPEAIESVTALIHPKQVNVVCEPEAAKRRPSGSYDAQFSIHYLVAAALTKGRFTLEELTESAYTDPGILALADRVTYAPDPNSTYPTHYSGELRIRLKSGEEIRHREAINRGARENPLSVDQVKDKFLGNAARAVSPARAEDIAAAVLNLESQTSLKPLAELLRAEHAAPC